ncbi:FliH/SctL family protein [Thalassotalea sp. PLHSN55]|uniref:FliH/SctL family protein n=1 Tax=Thalassotalea sp. PLHSN55 TaxID=3435888 RepID=UPI003F82AC5C
MTKASVNQTTTQWRRHRFPPFREYNEFALEDSIDSQAEHNAKFEDGFQQGVELGHQEGLKQGYQQGLAQGEEDGRQQGFSQGKVQGQQLFNNSLALLAKSQEKVEQLSHHKLVEQQKLIADIVAQVAQRVVRAELTLNPRQVLSLVEEAMQSLTDEVDKVRIFLNHEDKKRLNELGIETLQGWPLEEDSELAVGDCFIRSKQMEIAVDTQDRFAECMANVEQSLLANNHSLAADVVTDETASDEAVSDDAVSDDAAKDTDAESTRSSDPVDN